MEFEGIGLDMSAGSGENQRKELCLVLQACDHAKVQEVHCRNHRVELTLDSLSMVISSSCLYPTSAPLHVCLPFEQCIPLKIYF